MEKKIKITKKAKKIVVKETTQPITKVISEYTCPSCKICFVGGQPYLDTTRFLCDCGQELIVEKRISK